jgi:hypothetical protein
MAYLEPASVFAAETASPITSAWTLAGEETSGFSPLEWTVIALARRDRLSSLEMPGPIARAFGGLFGLGRQSGLADPQLETLRRAAVLAWHKGYTLPVSEIKRFLSGGFSAAQLETMLASITSQRTLARRRRTSR